MSVGPAGVQLTTSRMTAQCSTNIATGAWYKVSKSRFLSCIHFKPEQHKTMSIHNVSFIGIEGISFIFSCATLIRNRGIGFF